jgi:outer membrane protein assembly factor BamB
VTEPRATASAPEDAAGGPDGDRSMAAGPVAAPASAPPVTPADAALIRYGADLRRRRIAYFAVLAVLLAAVGTVVGVAWSRGEVSHASLHRFRPGPPNLPLASPSANPQPAWRTSDRLADGVPQWFGTVITFSDHTVGGRNARTGARTWSYTRTDRTICAVGQAAGTTIAAFENRGNCDELDAFYSGTGTRRWTRTLDFDGLPINGRPTFQTTAFTYMITSGLAVYAIDPVTGYNRWTYHRDACRIRGAVLGSAGALISQTCSPRVKCAAQKFCQRGAQVFLRDGSAGRQDDSKDNPDKIKWLTADGSTLPVAADQVVLTVEPDAAALHLLDPTKGTLDRRLPLPAASGAGAPSAVAAADAEIVWLAGRTYVIKPDATRPLWSRATSSLPTVVSSTGQADPALADARITVSSAGGVAVLNSADGRVSAAFKLGAQAPGSVAWPLGTGFVVGAANGVVAYR